MRRDREKGRETKGGEEEGWKKGGNKKFSGQGGEGGSRSWR